MLKYCWLAQEGQKLRVRVLQTDSKKRKLMLTHKKTLINTKLKLISSYTVEVGTVAHGFITGFRKSGIVVSAYTALQFFALVDWVPKGLPSNTRLTQVTFFDNVHGLISITSLRRLLRLDDGATPEQCVDQMKKVYRVGQVGKQKKCEIKFYAFSPLFSVWHTFCQVAKCKVLSSNPRKQHLQVDSFVPFVALTLTVCTESTM